MWGNLHVYKIRDYSVCDMCIWIVGMGVEDQRENEFEFIRVKREGMKRIKIGVFCVPGTFNVLVLSTQSGLE